MKYFIQKLLSICFIFFFSNFLHAIQLDVPFLMHQDSTGGAMKAHVTLVKTTTGEIRVFWNDYRNGNSDIMGRLLYEDGTISDNGLKINDDTGFANQENPVIDITSIDYCVMVWEDEREGSKDIYGQKIGADLYILGENFKVNSTSDYSIQQNPAISLNDTGEFLIVWEDNGHGKWDIFGQKFDYWGLPVGDNFLISTLSGQTDAVHPAVGYHEDGTAVIAWCDERNGNADLFMRWYDANGNVLQSDTLVNDDGGTASQLYPALCVAYNDTGFVVWADTRNGNADIFMQKFTMKGELIGSNQLIHTDEDGDEQNHPAIHIGDSTIVVVWDDYRHGHQDIYSRTFDLNGNPVSELFKVNTDTTYTEQSYPAVFVEKRGFFVSSWIDYREGYPNVYTQQYWSYDGPNGDNVLMNQDGYSSNQEEPAASMNNQGISCTCWQDERHLYADIFVQFRNENGDALGNNLRVNTTSDSRYKTSPDCDINAKGESVVVWRYDDREGFMEIRGQRFDENHQPVADNFTINENGNEIADNNPSVAIDASGAFSVVWRDTQDDGYGIYIRHYNAEGASQGSPMLINDNAIAADLRNPAIAKDTSGYTLVVWEDNRSGNYDIYCQWIDSNGVFMDDNLLVISDTLNAYQGNPKVSLNANGQGIIAWRDNRPGYPGIFAQYVHVDSGFAGENFLVQTVAEPIRQLFPDAGIDNYGNAVIVWQELHGEDYILKSLKFDDEHQKAGLTDYMTGITTPSQNSFPAVAVSQSHILYVWQDANRSRGWDVYGRLSGWQRKDPATGVLNSPVKSRKFETVCNYPNPFNSETMIQYTLESNAYLTVSIFNIQGKLIRKLFNASQKPGRYTLNWDGKDHHGAIVSSGVYLVQVKTGMATHYHRMLLMK